MSNTARFWIGVPLSIPALLLSFGAFWLGGWAGHGLGSGSEGGTSLGLTIALLVVVAVFVLALVRRDTRFYAVGVFVGSAAIMAVGLGFVIHEMSTWTNF